MTQINAKDEIARYIRIFVNGMDLTNECFFLDLASQVAKCYLTDDKGKRLLTDAGEPAEVEYHARGKLAVEPAPDAPEWVSEAISKMIEEVKFE